MCGVRMGVTFPQADLELDAGATREFAQAVEEMGFDHMLCYDHVLGAGRRTRPDWDRIHDEDHRFHEILVLFGYLAAVTEKIELATGVMCLPQRETALVAKQAAEVDHLSGGRMRLGVGVGWNEVEFGGMGKDFHTRGRRIEEQIEVLRALWTNPTVEFEGEFHSLPDVGINPLPIQQPIPIWYGSGADKILDRVARLADGWLPESRSPEGVAPQLEKLRGLLVRHGRDPDAFGLQARLSLRDGDPDHWRRCHAWYLENGFTHFAVATIWCGASTLDEHLAALERFRDEVGVPQ
jgi:probable F420-dependent oxidoreductase